MNFVLKYYDDVISLCLHIYKLQSILDVQVLKKTPRVSCSSSHTYCFTSDILTRKLIFHVAVDVYIKKFQHIVQVYVHNFL